MDAPAPAAELSRIQRRLVAVLAAAQILGGLGMGASISTGALLVTSVSGDEAWSGLAATTLTLGAGLTAIPLATLAARRGRRIALACGAGTAVLGAGAVVTAASWGSLPLLLSALMLLGTGTAAGLQARFAATDLAAAQHRGRDLSLVVWSTTIGAVVGPNLLGPGGKLAALIGVPPLAGPFLITIASQVAAGVLYLVALRPDPLLRSRELLALAAAETLTEPGSEPVAEPVFEGVPPETVVTSGAISEVIAERPTFAQPRLPVVARYAITTTATSQAVMVGVMAMTPVHLLHHGASLSVVGFTISLHIAGMYALSPVFGILADRLGRVPIILFGQALLLAAVLSTCFGAESHAAVSVGLILLGLGWSAATVAGSSLLADSVGPGRRAWVQGISDLIMNLSGALAGALGGLILAVVGYNGLSLVSAGVVVTVVIVSVLAWRSIRSPAL